MKIKLLLTVFAITHQLFSADRLPTRDTFIDLEEFISSELLMNRLNARIYTLQEQFLLDRLLGMQYEILARSLLFRHESIIINEQLAFLERLLTQEKSLDDSMSIIRQIHREKKRRHLLIQRVLQENPDYSSLEQILFIIFNGRRNVLMRYNQQNQESGQRRQRTDSSESSQATTVLLSQNGSPAPSISSDRLFSPSRSRSRSLSSSDQTVPLSQD